ncbi:hypothetical protein AB0C34_17260 [Nocardia sp. NPDC049220]|uniref:hypothetical protein n=1 Tax=Nocardia sp. NPDC049220 TaxID=3155273 RepID=UPI0033EF81A8
MIPTLDHDTEIGEDSANKLRRERQLKDCVTTPYSVLAPGTVVICAPTPDDDGWRLYLTAPDGRPYTHDVPVEALCDSESQFKRAVKERNSLHEYWFARNTLRFSHTDACAHVRRGCKVTASQLASWGFVAFATLPAGPFYSYGPATAPRRSAAAPAALAAVA